MLALWAAPAAQRVVVPERRPRIHRQAPLWLAVLVLGYATLPLAHLFGEFSARPIGVPLYGIGVTFALGAAQLPEAGPTDRHETGTRHTGCPICAGLVSSRNVLTTPLPSTSAPILCVHTGARKPVESPPVGRPQGSAFPRAPPLPV
jgi:hypothetical protein